MASKKWLPPKKTKQERKHDMRVNVYRGVASGPASTVLAGPLFVASEVMVVIIERSLILKLISESKSSGCTYVRVASCMLLHIHKEKTDELNLNCL